MNINVNLIASSQKGKNETSNRSFYLLMCGIQAYADDLYKSSVNKENVCGKPLIMDFKEIERTDKYSVCKIKHEKGAAFASIAFEMHCYCEIAKARNAKYFAPIENSRKGK